MKNILITAGIAILLLVLFRAGKKIYLRPGNITGAKAAQIEGLIPNGSHFKLSDLQGSYVLIDFWGSWCTPCRRSNAELTGLYSIYHNRSFKDADGFEIVSIGIENDQAQWHRAIEADSLSWPYHLMESATFDSPISKAYDVHQIPTKFLINPEGVIMAVDPSIDDITRLLDDRVKSL